MFVYIGSIPDAPVDRTVDVRVDNDDTFTLCHTLAHVIVPMLEAFKEHKQAGIWGFCFDDPNDHSDEAAERALAKQHAILDKMLYAFRAYRDEGDEDDPLVKEGLALFAKHYSNLWR